MALDEKFTHENLAYLRTDEIEVASGDLRTKFMLFSLSGEKPEFLINHPTPEDLGRFLAEKVYLGTMERRPFFIGRFSLFRLDTSEDCSRFQTAPSYEYKRPYLAANDKLIALNGVASNTDDFFKVVAGYRERFGQLMKKIG
jgi:hypothetical protein